MKTRLLIIAGIIISIGISLAIIAFTMSDESSKSHGRFNYKNTDPIIQDTYLDKTISQWQKESHESLMSYHDIHGDKFFENLGALVIKNEMLNELNKQNIQVLDSDFKVYSGMVLTSLPPHVSFEAFVNDTDSNTYRVSGMTQSAEVGDIRITKLEFFDTDEKLSRESVLSPSNTVVLQKKDNDEIAIPRNLIISGNSDIEVNFQNNFVVPVRIQGNGDWQNPDWYGPTILPGTTGTRNFDTFGVYEWHSRTLPLPGSIASDYMGGGEILIIPDDMGMLSFQDKENIGTAILQSSEIPWAGIWSNNNGILIEFNRAIFDALPDAKEYYQARAEQLIPFDIPITVEDPYENYE